MNLKFFLLGLYCCGTLSVASGAVKEIRVTPPAEGGDATRMVAEVLREAGESAVRLVFAPGTYRFYPQYADGKYHGITNHTNGYKYIAFDLTDRQQVEIDGGGAEFLFHGTMLPFLIENSADVTIRNVSIDWETPFLVQGEVVATNPDEGWYDLRMAEKGYSWKVENGALKFPVVDGFTYSSTGESLVFDAQTRGPVYNAGSMDIHRKRDVPVQKRPDGTVRFFEKLKTYLPIGSIMTFKGPMGENRYAPAIHCLGSEKVLIEDVKVYHALGMGFLGERSRDITLRRFDVCLREGSDRMVSATADATHFCNCAGNVLVEECLFENMLDDGTNVHGTYVRVEKILGPNRLGVRLQHFQQGGFLFGQPGDRTWFLMVPSPERVGENTIKEFLQVNDFYAEVTFQDPLPSGLREGDLLENKSWNTDSFIMRRCTIRNNRARNIVLKAPGEVLIEKNTLQSMMASILMRGESVLWYESGAAEDVTIRNNRFEQCVLGGGEQAVLYIVPRMDKRFDKKQTFDRNVVFEGNTVRTFDNMIVFATQVDGLTLRNNTIVQDTSRYKPFHADAPLIELSHCKRVTVEGNCYQGSVKEALRTDKATAEEMTAQNNQW